MCTFQVLTIPHHTASPSLHSLASSSSFITPAVHRNLYQSFLKLSFNKGCMNASNRESFKTDKGQVVQVFASKASISGYDEGESSRADRVKSSEEGSSSSFQWRRRSEVIGKPGPSKPKQEGGGVYRKSFAGGSQRSAAPQGSIQSTRASPSENGDSRNRTFISQEENGSYAEKRKMLPKLREVVQIQEENGSYAEKRKKPPKIREQVQILSPLRKDPHVAILGGGMSGLICALTLQEKGIRSTVFDTGKHGLGGRMGTRHVAQAGGLPLVFDHAAQYFTVTDPRFAKLVNQWSVEGAIKQWNGVVGMLEKGGQFTELPGGNKYIATNGMRLLADHLLSSKRELIEVRRPCWISKLDEVNGLWHLTENGKDQGDFDMVVIAHNGKCANRLLGPVGVPLVAKQMKRLELSSIWALMAAFEKPFPSIDPGGQKALFDGAFVSGVNSLSWMGNNTAKLQLPHGGDGPYCWTFFSTAAYGKKNKVPQESIPTARADRVKREMLQGVEKALGLAEGTLPAPLYMKVQLWGAALPLNTPDVPCVFDAYGRVGICGDWLLGSSLEAAALSGIAMANHISSYCDARGLNPEGFCVGLTKEFSNVDGHDIGQFVEMKTAQEFPLSKMLTAV